MVIAQLIGHGARGGFRGFGGRLPALIVLVLIPALIVALVVYAGVVLWHQRTQSAVSTQAPFAQRILDERFARGDIDAETYIQQSDVLRATHTQTTSAVPAQPPPDAPAPPLETTGGDDASAT